jgi:cytochrome c553
MSINNFNSDRSGYLDSRRLGGCIECKAIIFNPISRLCGRCHSRYGSHGSPKVPKPSLRTELDEALFAVIGYCDLDEPRKAFDAYMSQFIQPPSNDAFRRLCRLHFSTLRCEDGTPLMTFRDVLTQALAVNLYEERGGKIDHKRNQLKYLLGRSCLSVWGKRRQVKHHYDYDRHERRQLQRRPKVFREDAFQRIYIEGGINRFLAKLKTNTIGK